MAGRATEPCPAKPLGKVMREWSVNDVCKVLRDVRWVDREFWVLLAAHGLDGEGLVELTLDELQRDLFVNSKVQAEAMLREIAVLDDITRAEVAVYEASEVWEPRINTGENETSWEGVVLPDAEQGEDAMLLTPQQSMDGSPRRMSTRQRRSMSPTHRSPSLSPGAVAAPATPVRVGPVFLGGGEGGDASGNADLDSYEAAIEARYLRVNEQLSLYSERMPGEPLATTAASPLLRRASQIRSPATPDRGGRDTLAGTSVRTQQHAVPAGGHAPPSPTPADGESDEDGAIDLGVSDLLHAGGPLPWLQYMRYQQTQLTGNGRLGTVPSEGCHVRLAAADQVPDARLGEAALMNVFSCGKPIELKAFSMDVGGRRRRKGGGGTRGVALAQQQQRQHEQKQAVVAASCAPEATTLSDVRAGEHAAEWQGHIHEGAATAHDTRRDVLALRADGGADEVNAPTPPPRGRGGSGAAAPSTGGGVKVFSHGPPADEAGGDRDDDDAPPSGGPTRRLTPSQREQRRHYKLTAKRRERMRLYGVWREGGEYKQVVQHCGILERSKRFSMLQELYTRWDVSQNFNGVPSDSVPFMTVLTVLQAFFYWPHPFCDPDGCAHGVPVDRHGGVSRVAFQEYVFNLTELLPVSEFDYLMLFADLNVVRHLEAEQELMRKQRALFELFEKWDVACNGYLTSQFMSDLLIDHNKHAGQAYTVYLEGFDEEIAKGRAHQEQTREAAHAPTDDGVTPPAAAAAVAPFVEGVDNEGEGGTVRIHLVGFIALMTAATKGIAFENFEVLFFKLNRSFQIARELQAAREAEEAPKMAVLPAPGESERSVYITPREVRAAFLLSDPNTPVVFIGRLAEPAASLEIYSYERRRQLIYSAVGTAAAAKASLAKLREAISRGQWHFISVAELYEAADDYLREVAYTVESTDVWRLHKRFRVFLHVPKFNHFPQLLMRRAVTVKADTRDPYQFKYVIEPAFRNKDKTWR